MDIASGLKQDIVHELSLMLHQENLYVQNLQTAQELLRDNDSNQALKVVIYEEKRPRTEHARCFNRPVSDEIGILMPNAPTNNRDIVLHYRNGHLDQVSELHRAYDALQYPLLFPYGTDGWQEFIVNTVLATFHSRTEIALATASSGIAATLLSGGRTLHSRFRVPLDAHRQELPMCSIKKGTVLAKIISDCKAIIVYEAPMTHRCAFEAVDRSLRDIRCFNAPLAEFQHCCVAISDEFYQLSGMELEQTSLMPL